MRRAATVQMGFRVQEMSSTRRVYQVWTDHPDRGNSAFYLPDVPAGTRYPATGDHIEWDTGHAFWNGLQLRKLGYSFDPDAPIH